MKKYIIFIFAISIFASSCKKEQDLSNLKEFFYLRNKGADMPVYIEGNASSKIFVVVIHGGPGGDAKVYNDYNTYFSDPLEEKYAMVYYDQRGSGTATGNYKSSDLTVAQHVEDLEALIAYIQKEYGTDNKIFLMGHSWGGALGSAFLIKSGNQDNIAGWIEVDGAHNFANNAMVCNGLNQISAQQISAGKNLEKWKEIFDYTSKIDTANISDIEMSQLNGYGFKAEQYLVQDGLITTSKSDPKGIFNYQWFSGHNPLIAKFNLRITNATMFNDIKTLDYTPELYKITIPCIFMWGRHDYVIPYQMAYTAYNAVSSTNKEVVIFETSGHSVMFNELDEFLDEMMNFVDGVAQK
jgi:pimeloyl-ACP methyl ester carboxylesterase